PPPADDPASRAIQRLDSSSGALSPDGKKSAARLKFDGHLKKDSPQHFWSRTKKWADNHGFTDKALAAQVNQVFDKDFGKKLSDWDKYNKNLDGEKLLQADQDLASIITTYDQRLDALNSKDILLKDSAAIDGMREALRAIAERLSVETKFLKDQDAFDPYVSATKALDVLSTLVNTDSPASRNQLDAALKTKAPDDVWTTAKGAMMGLMTDKKLAKKIGLVTDKKLAAKVDNVFGSALSTSLSSWSKLVTNTSLDGKKILDADHDIADTISTYDEQLQKLLRKNPSPPAPSSLNMSINGLREALHAIAARVSSETKRLQQEGAFNNPN